MFKFEVGKVYSAHSVCDYDSVFAFKILSRTAKTAKICNVNCETQVYTRKITIDTCEDTEEIFPLGKYSFAPRLIAGRKPQKHNGLKVKSQKPGEPTPDLDLPQIDGVHFEVYNPFGI